MNVDRFNKIICEKRITDAELGRRIGVSRQTIGQYRKGERHPSEGSVKKIAEALHTDLLWLMGYDDTEREISMLLKDATEDTRMKVLEYVKEMIELEKLRKMYMFSR